MPVAPLVVAVEEQTRPSMPKMAPQQRLLMRTCLTSLGRAYLPDAGIFAGVATWNGSSWTRSAPSAENTANALVALYELRRRGAAIAFDPDEIMDRVILDCFHDLDYTSIAFLLWADSLGERRYEPILWNALRARMPANVSQTMQLGWTLSALSQYVSVASDAAAVARLAKEIYGRISANQSRSGLFFASGARHGWLRRRRADGSLSSQAYPIHALALYGRVFDVPDAIVRAERCADALCALQGPDGQWWWRYDIEAARVTEKYPLFAVSQDTAMPMCLGELQRVRGTRRYAAAIEQGLAWLFGRNELSQPLVDEADGVLWRAIRHREGRFELVRETHSYHAARCLYHLCTQAGS